MGSRRVRSLRPLVALVALLGLAACTAGVPKTGSVVVVSPAARRLPTVNPQTFEDAGGPASGLTESEVAVGFMNAMNTGNLSTIQRWVLPQARDRVARWSERPPTIRVYSVFEPGLPYARGDRWVVPVKVKLVGQLEGSREWYPATGDDLLSWSCRRTAPTRGSPTPAGPVDGDVTSAAYASVEVFMVPTLHPSPVRPGAGFVPAAPRATPGAGATGRARPGAAAPGQGAATTTSTPRSAGHQAARFRYAHDVATVDLWRGHLRDRSGRLRAARSSDRSRLLQTARSAS